jgi:hypothetical protein
MCPATDNPARCEIHTVIHFLHVKNISASEIQCDLCVVHSQNVMSEGTCKAMVHNVERQAGEQMFTIKSKVVSHL